MITLTLLERDAQVLADVLTHDLSELRMEISHTDRMAFREGLKEKKLALVRVLEGLEDQLADRAGSPL